MKDYQHLMRLLLYVPAVGEQPMSALWVGRPGGGKSTLLTKSSGSNCMILNDVTAAGVETILDQFDKDHHYAYIVIPDMLKPMSRRSKPFLTFCNIALEEGVSNIVRKDFTFQTKNGGAKFGILGAITTDEFRLHYHTLESIGFISRSLIIDFKPPMEPIARKMSQGIKPRHIKYQIPPIDEAPRVVVPRAISDLIYDNATAWAETEHEIPLRKINTLLRLTKANALVRHIDAHPTERGRHEPIEVSHDDVREVVHLLRRVLYRVKQNRW